MNNNENKHRENLKTNAFEDELINNKITELNDMDIF
jgi:hypothetical protein